MTSPRVMSSVDRDDKIPQSFWDHRISLLSNSSFRWDHLQHPELEARDTHSVLWYIYSLEVLQIWTHKGVA